MPDAPIQFRIMTKITLVKYDGDPPAEGEEKEPVEIIEFIDEGFPVEIIDLIDKPSPELKE